MPALETSPSRSPTSKSSTASSIDEKKGAGTKSEDADEYLPIADRCAADEYMLRIKFNEMWNVFEIKNSLRTPQSLFQIADHDQYRPKDVTRNYRR